MRNPDCQGWLNKRKLISCCGNQFCFDFIWDRSRFSGTSPCVQKCGGPANTGYDDDVDNGYLRVPCGGWFSFASVSPFTGAECISDDYDDTDWAFVLRPVTTGGDYPYEYDLIFGGSASPMLRFPLRDDSDFGKFGYYIQYAKLQWPVDGDDGYLEVMFGAIDVQDLPEYPPVKYRLDITDEDECFAGSSFVLDAVEYVDPDNGNGLHLDQGPFTFPDEVTLTFAEDTECVPQLPGTVYAQPGTNAAAGEQTWLKYYAMGSRQGTGRPQGILPRESEWSMSGWETPDPETAASCIWCDKMNRTITDGEGLSFARRTIAACRAGTLPFAKKRGRCQNDYFATATWTDDAGDYAVDMNVIFLKSPLSTVEVNNQTYTLKSTDHSAGSFHAWWTTYVSDSLAVDVPRVSQHATPECEGPDDIEWEDVNSAAYEAAAISDYLGDSLGHPILNPGKENYYPGDEYSLNDTTNTSTGYGEYGICCQKSRMKCGATNTLFKIEFEIDHTDWDAEITNADLQNPYFMCVGDLPALGGDTPMNLIPFGFYSERTSTDLIDVTDSANTGVTFGLNDNSLRFFGGATNSDYGWRLKFTIDVPTFASSVYELDVSLAADSPKYPRPLDIRLGTAAAFWAGIMWDADAIAGTHNIDNQASEKPMTVTVTAISIEEYDDSRPFLTVDKDDIDPDEIP